MSLVSSEFEGPSKDTIEEPFSVNASGQKIPASLNRATLRLEFPPSYVVVGVYRLFTDKALYVPAWNKCKHATQRGAIVAGIWACLSFGLQRKFVESFLINSRRVTGLSHDTILGFKNPFDLPTYATVIILSSQVSFIFAFFLRRNIRIARERAWAQTVQSRGKGNEFWQPYVEEWEFPPFVDESSKGNVERWFGTWVGRIVLRRILLLPFALDPIIHIILSACLKSLGTARYLHKPYFESKKMSRHQAAVFVEERKWDYRTFGFAAALLEGLPIVGLIFTVSNRIGAAMWAHDLEKRQHFIAAERLRVGVAIKDQ